MNNLNSILLEGNLTKDPELSYTPKGTAVCVLRVASNRFYKQDEEYQKEVSYFDVTVWARQAEVCADHLTKGRGVRVVGRLKQDRWQDPEGNNRSKVHVIAEHVEFVPLRKEQGEGVEGDQEQSREEGDGEEDREAASF